MKIKALPYPTPHVYRNITKSKSGIQKLFKVAELIKEFDTFIFYTKETYTEG